MPKYIMALDQGTTSSRCLIFDEGQNIVGRGGREFTQYYPKPGWVEHDPDEIYVSQMSAMSEAAQASGVDIKKIAAIGVTNQRETTVVWEKATGKPVYNAIVWQCRRTADICARLKADGLEGYIQEATGLLIDAYFSATKLMWILNEVPGAREKAERGELLFGTVDTWLLWKLTKGAVHATDYTNASRTMFFNIHSLEWDEKLLGAMDIPRQMLPEIFPSAHVYGSTDALGAEIPIAGMAGDQQAALFGQGCFAPGTAKNTYGTGCFMLMNTGGKPCVSANGLLTTMAASFGGKPCYAVEGSVFMGGAVIQWLRDELKLIDTSADSEYFAGKVKDNGGVYVVPAFTGLGAPRWDMYARGAVLGLTRGTGKDHIIRAALEAIAYQTNDVIVAMRADAGLELTSLKADGGASANRFLMKFQSDISQLSVLRSATTEATAIGAARLAGIGAGMYKDGEDAAQGYPEGERFVPDMEEDERAKLLSGWDKAVGRSMGWSEE